MTMSRRSLAPTRSSWPRASDLLVDVLVRNGKAGSPDALALAKRVVASKERLLGPAELDLAPSLDNLGAVHVERGEFRLAIPLHQRSLSVRLRALPPTIRLWPTASIVSRFR